MLGEYWTATAGSPRASDGLSRAGKMTPLNSWQLRALTYTTEKLRKVSGSLATNSAS
jgi:hypothetical protein